MFGKLFESMYDGTLVASWEALVTFQQMIVLADDVGVIDITPSALSARTGIPLGVIKKGISVLEADDPYSRSPDQGGRRIERLDDHRPWGWQIVNYMTYRHLANHEGKKKADRQRIAVKRAAEKKANKNKRVADCSEVSRKSQSVADVAHTDTDTDTDTEKRGGARKRGTRLPEDWCLPEPWITWALKKGHRTPEAAAEKFYNHWTSTSRNGTKLDWFATWRNWILNDLERQPREGSGATSFEGLS